MSKASEDQYDKDGRLINGYDYINQAWVIGGRYQDCGHPQPGEFVPALRTVFDGCSCYGRAHAGEYATYWRNSKNGQTTVGIVQNGHHPDCDDPHDPEYNYLCSLLCPLRTTVAGTSGLQVAKNKELPSIPDLLLREWVLYAEGALDKRQAQSLHNRSEEYVERHV